ncbi:MAG: adenosylmethionine--8-amino-7-oxononanoate transaminase [Thermoguttaceae bacterium]|nr:adenosylmethionine--8-amino-7-oxononanoate transaminase [Thermoguttaceae bacterium]
MNLAARDLKYIWHPCSQMKDYEELPPMVIDHAKGIWLYGVNGERYADVISSWWCNLLGHCNARISNAVKDQLDRMEHVIFANFTHEPAIELCEKLVSVLPKGLTKFFFTDNGSSAVEVAMKMSFQYHLQTGRSKKVRFMALSDAYHGETLGALSVGDLDLYSKMYKPLMLDVIRIAGPDCYRCPYGKTRETCSSPCIENAAQTFQQHADECTAILVEPLVQGSAGMKIYPPAYLTKLRELCDRFDVHLIADEIAVGFGRTGTMFACQQAGISPDLICLSKGLTGGYMPMALVVTTQKIFGAFYDDYATHRAFLHSHTYSGNPLGCRAALEVLRIFEDEPVLENAVHNAPYLNQKLREAFDRFDCVGEIRQIGLINAIELVADRQTKKPFDSRLRLGYQVYQEALKAGVLLRPLGDVLYFNPPIVITRDEIDWTVERAAKSLENTLTRNNYKK